MKIGELLNSRIGELLMICPYMWGVGPGLIYGILIGRIGSSWVGRRVVWTVCRGNG
jgi:hypothetical protein